MKLQMYVATFHILWTFNLYSAAASVRERYHRLYPEAVTA